MVEPYEKLYEKSGMWYASALPGKALHKLMLHLASTGEPRLYVTLNSFGYPRKPEVSDSLEEKGWKTQIDVRTLLRGSTTASNKSKPWIEPDEKLTKRQQNSSRKVYRISKAGREMLAQYETRRRLEEEGITFEEKNVEVARRILAECRKKFGVSK